MSQCDISLFSQDKYRDNYVEENENFVPYQKKDKSLYSNAFLKFGEYRFCSLERIRLVQSIMMAPHSENGADLQCKCLLFASFQKPSVSILILTTLSFAALMDEYPDCISDMYPMHDNYELEKLEAIWFDNQGTTSRDWNFVPEKEIRDYFGEKIALYTVFASFYTGKLMFLAPLGIIAMISQAVDGEDTIMTPIYAFVVAIWATLFLEYWKRRESTLRCQWNVESFEDNEAVRPEFFGDSYSNPITGKHTIVYPALKVCGVPLLGPSLHRSAKLLVSLTVLLTLAVTVVLSTLCLMLVKSAVETNGMGTVGMVVIGMLNFMLIETMNQVYRKLALVMTDWENHTTQTQYDDHLIAKCFIFQFFNSYCSFFYIAFLEGHSRIFGVKDTCAEDDCMKVLRIQLATIFMMHTLFGQAVEVLWPFLQESFIGAWHAFTFSLRICCWNIWRRFKAYFCYIPVNDAEEDAIYETIDSNIYTDEEQNGFRPTFPGVLVEYNELVLQYGYVILFAPAFPLAALLAVLNNVVELKSDGFKLCKSYRRPQYICAQDIGSWQYIIEVVSVLAVVTNCAIIAFTSHSLARLHVVEQKDKLTQVLLAFFAEHTLLMFKIFIHLVIEDEPEHVQERRDKREYEARKALIIEEATESEQERYEFRTRFIDAPDEYEQHVDM